MSIPKADWTLAAAAAVFLAVSPARASDAASLAAEAANKGQPGRGFDIAMAGMEDPVSDRGLFLLAVELLPEDSRAGARRLAEASAAVLKKRPADYAGYLGACKALRVLARYPEALPNCRKALELEPVAYPPYRELGLVYAAAGEQRKAEETFGQGVEISSASCRARYYLARMLEKRGNAAAAAASYQKCLDLAQAAPAADARRFASLCGRGLQRTRKRRAAGAKPGPARAAAQPMPAAAAPPAPKPEIKTQPQPGAPANTAAACREKIREELRKDNLPDALGQSETCLGLFPSDPELAAERAALLARLGRVDEAAAEYGREAGLRREPRAAARARISAAETWRKIRDFDKALAQYRLALQADPGSREALEGIAGVQEARSEPEAAAATYAEILKLDPGNALAGSRLKAIKDAALDDEQVLAELKLRRAVDPAQASLLPEDKKLFACIKAAEAAGAVDRLRKELNITAGLTIKRPDKRNTRVLLTGAGYRKYASMITREAIQFFENEKIDFRDLFKLRTEKGDDIFDQAGKLTPEGEDFWRSRVPGRKSWLLPSEPIPASPAAVQANKDITEAEKKGYREIYEPEYLWLLRATDCPEDVMKAPPLSLLFINDGARVRYMLCYVADSPCMNTMNDKLVSYIESYRAGNDEISDSGTSTAFFGTGGLKKRRFCENGRLFGADDSPALPPDKLR